MANLFLTPKIVYTGADALDMSKNSIKGLGKKALVVTGKNSVKIGNAKKVTDMLESIGIDSVVYSEITGEPCDYMIEEGAKVYKENGCDFLVSIGGGSPMDSMKAIGVVVACGGSINDYMGKVITTPLAPMVAIPTTAGTGSETTQFTIINNTVENIKMLLKGPTLMPDIAVVDPHFTLTAPQKITSATGIDALCHAVESYTSVKAFPMADTMALSAVKRIFNSLYECYVNGSNVEARADMATAALEAGMSFNNSSVTIIHGMSRPIGALYHVPHGLSNAMLAPKCLEFAMSGCPERFCTLAQTIGVYKEGMTAEDGAKAFIDAVSELCKKLDIQTPAQFGIDKEDFFKNIDKMATDAIASGSPANTRRNPNKEEIMDIYKSLFD